MVETEEKTKSVMTMTMKTIQPRGHVRELMAKRPQTNVTALVIKMKVRMRFQEENKEGQPTELEGAEPKVAVRKTVM